MKTFKIEVGATNFGWITVSGGQIVSCSERHKWAIHLNYERLTNWLSKLGTVKIEKV